MSGISLAEVRSGHDIVAVVLAHGVVLARRGADHWGLCPFHDDRSPSFKVTTGRQAFFCFGCGVKGDVIDVVARIESVDLVTAVRRLQGVTQATGRPLPPPAPRDPAREEAALRAKIAAARRIWSQGQPPLEPASKPICERGD